MQRGLRPILTISLCVLCVAAWTADQYRARDERLLVLDTLASLFGEIGDLHRDLDRADPASEARLSRLEDKVDELSRRVMASANR